MLVFRILFGIAKKKAQKNTPNNIAKKTKNNILKNIAKNMPVGLVIFHKSVKIPNCGLCKAKLQITRMGTFAGLHYRE
ncbi:hypothetical protein HMPREF1581_01494 [Gardnerella vaginalis JCP8108]|uniref:Uncharacterized protein n=1 Tax=Gardnerella vaginalis JCP8108 TaxID=1261066 RepID=S4GM86_GARVA|nr:hypothetical protein HMPREF1581_01494 [Gardnerella vaginalis JCP8108]